MKKISKRDLKNIRIILKGTDEKPEDETDDKSSSDGKAGIIVGLFACAAAVGYLGFVLYSKLSKKPSAPVNGDDDFDDCAVKDGSCNVCFEAAAGTDAPDTDTTAQTETDNQ